MTNYLESLNMKVTNLASAYCEKYNNGAKQKDLKAAKKAATDAVNNYNLELSKEQYREWAKQGNPVELAVRSRLVPGAIKITFKEKDEVMGYAVKPAEYLVSLPMMQVILGDKVFADKRWFDALEKLCLLVLNYLNERVGNGSFNYHVADSAASFEFPADVDPLSDDGIVVALQQVVDKILYIENPDTNANIIHTTTGTDSLGRTYSKEWTIIRESMTAAGGCNKVVVCNTVKFSEYLLNAMHGMLTHGEFGLITDEEYLGMDALAKKHADSQITKDTTEPPQAQEIPETHTPAKDKPSKAKTEKTSKAKTEKTKSKK